MAINTLKKIYILKFIKTFKSNKKKFLLNILTYKKILRLQKCAYALLVSIHAIIPLTNRKVNNVCLKGENFAYI